MATQLHFAFSNDIRGCAVLAGPPYYCAGGLLTAAKCLSGPVTSVSIPTLERQLKSYEKDRSIDQLTNIKENPVYLFTGKYDPIALPGIVKLNEKLYSSFGAKIKTNYEMGATHGFPTGTFGGSCAVPNLSNFLNNWLDRNNDRPKLTKSTLSSPLAISVWHLIFSIICMELI